MSKKNKKPREKRHEQELVEVLDQNPFKGLKLNIKPFNFTDKQKTFIKLALDKNTKIIFVNGPAGTSKTLCAVYVALRMLVENPKIEIKYIRTIAESSERSIGALPGDLEDKFDPFLMPLYDKLEELLPPQQANHLVEQNMIQAIPINFLRGASFRDKIIIGDELQNFSKKEIITLLTRIGEGTKLFLLGDPFQSDIRGPGGFNDISQSFNNEKSAQKGIHYFEFLEEDIMRSEILKYIVSVLKHTP